jgi:hypothetical protein
MPIQLPALGIQAPQQTDILGQAAKLRQFQAMGQEQQLRGQQIQAGQLENQMRQRELQDQQTTMQILGKHGGDLESALPELASSVSAKTFLGLQKSAVDLKKSTAELDNKTLENKKLQSDQFLGLIDSATKMDPATYQQNWPQIAARALEIEPQLKGHVDPNQPIPQQALTQYGTLFQTQSSAMAKETANRAQKEEDRKAALAPSQLASSQADATIKQAEAAAMQGGGVNPKIPLEVQEANSWLKLHPGKTLSDYQKYKATLVPAYNFSIQNGGATGSAGQPSAIAQAIAKGDMKWGDAISARTPMSVRQSLLKEIKQINPDFNSGDFAIEQGVKKDFTSGDAAKNLTAFNTAIEHAQQLQQATDAMGNGDVRTLNKIGNALGYEFGSDKKTNFEVIKNALSGEISKVFKGGQATDAEIREVRGPFNSANSPEQLKGAINGAIKLMNSKRDALKTQYDSGVKAKPNFGANAPAGASGAGDFFSNFGGKAKQ